MNVLVDTNILLRRLETAHPHHAVAVAAVDRLLRSGETLYVTLQNMAEAWRAMTAPAGANGLGFSVAASANALGQI